MIALGVALLAHLTVDPDFLEMRGFYAGLFTGGAHGLGTLQVIEVVLFAFLVAYVPLTHMSHFFTKWFMYHDIRWGDEPMNDEMGKKVGELLKMRPTWSAQHIGADGDKDWVDLATSDMPSKEDE